jgi:5'-3' exonuclease
MEIPMSSLLDFIELEKDELPLAEKEEGLMIIDFSQLVISGASFTFKKYEKYTPEDVHIMTLNILKNVIKKFKNNHPTIVIAMDSRYYWRKEIAPYYKGHRKDAREKSAIDFDTIYKGMDITKPALEEHFPYILMEVHGCEADDIAGVLVKNYNKNYENIMLISSDGDWAQLQKFKNVKQWSSMVKGFVHPKHGSPEASLMYKIIKGDKKDAISGILNAEDSVITKTRQKSISEKTVTSWINKDPKEYCNEIMLERFNHNKQILDLCNIPEKYESAVITEFEGKKGNRPSRAKIYPYLLKNRLSKLVESLGDF